MQNDKFFIGAMCNAVKQDFVLPKNAHRTGKEVPE